MKSLPKYVPLLVQNYHGTYLMSYCIINALQCWLVSNNAHCLPHVNAGTLLVRRSLLWWKPSKVIRYLLFSFWRLLNYLPCLQDKYASSLPPTPKPCRQLIILSIIADLLFCHRTPFRVSYMHWLICWQYQISQ